jgi:hypothetical protein
MRNRSMLPFAILLTFIIFVSYSSSSQTTQPPSTPAGILLKDWLVAFNSSDPSQISNYVTLHDSSKTVNEVMTFRAETGGFDLVAINRETPWIVDFEVREKASTRIAFGTLHVSPAFPTRVSLFSLLAAPPDSQYQQVTLNNATQNKLISSLAIILRQSYINSASAESMITALVQDEHQGRYKTFTDGPEFAQILTTQLQKVSNDKHLSVIFHGYKQPPKDRPADKLTNTIANSETNVSINNDNCGFHDIELLPGNIGYLRLDEFDNPQLCGDTAVAAMKFLSHANALIYDMRYNRGGDPSMVSLLASYLFDQPTHLNDLFTREDDSTHQFWTFPYVPGQRMLVPTFVLTSKNTFSGAEEFSYDLQMQKRASIIGETTAGGAHPTRLFDIDSHFSVSVPTSKAINPISHSNWEGKGVNPDVKVKSDNALASAHTMAMEAIRQAQVEKH